MNSDLFRSMREQLHPSEGSKTALREKLSNAPVRRSTSWKKYIALAACIAVLIAAFPIYTAVTGRDGSAKLHSYTLVEDNMPAADTETFTTTEDKAGVQGVLPEPDPQPETAVRETGILSQDEAQNLYIGLMEYFSQKYGSVSYEPVLPDWYGGGYLDNDRPDNIARLCVVLVEDLDTPELRQEIIAALGSDHVDFISGKYSRNRLRQLQESFADYPAIEEVFAGSWVDEEENLVHLELTEVSDEILELLAELDPDDDAISVTVGQRASIDVGVAW